MIKLTNLILLFKVKLNFSQIWSTNLLFTDTARMSGGVEVVSPAPGGESQDPLTNYFHQSPEHCSVSFAAINRMRQNIQVRSL